MFSFELDRIRNVLSYFITKWNLETGDLTFPNSPWNYLQVQKWRNNVSKIPFENERTIIEAYIKAYNVKYEQLNIINTLLDEM